MGSYSFSPQVVTQCSGSNDTGCQEKMTVTDGAGNYVTYLLTLNNGAWNSQMDYYNQGGAHLLRTTTNYNFSADNSYIAAQSQTTTLEDTGQTAQTVYSYYSSVVPKVTSEKEWDYYTGSPSATPTRETDFTYGYVINGAHLLTQRVLKDSSGNTVTQSTYNHDSNGNVLSVVSGTGSAQVTTYATYDSNGMVQSTKDGNGNTTTYTYTCSDAYPTTVSYPVIVSGQHLETETGYDCSTGLVTWTKDMNGVVQNESTTYSYFTSGSDIGQLHVVTRPDTGTTTYSYPSTTETDTSVAQTSSMNVISKAIMDAFGRPYQTVQSAPEGSISSETTYDATGRPECVTTAHLQGTSSSTDGSTCTSYDVLGRQTKVTMPDGNFVTRSYYGNTVTVTDELSHLKKYTYDAFQQLTSVLEPNASGTLAYETDYQYDALGDLTRVDQWGGAKGSAGDRVRLFAYDSLGRKIAESVPEEQSAGTPGSRTCSGASGSTWTKCYAYDGNGNVLTITDNSGQAISYTYDPLDRVKSVNYPGKTYGASD